LTRQEQAVLLRAQGWAYKRIGDYLGMAEMTVYRWLNEEYREREDRRRAARNRHHAKCELVRENALLKERVTNLEKRLEAWRKTIHSCGNSE
jgi:transposase